MNELDLLYRGSLKSCNYQCSYCPFSKHRMSDQELAKDKEQWEHFIQTVEEQAGMLAVRTVMTVPYGEALIHPWYWEGLARLSRAEDIKAVGAQTNLSFRVRESLELFDRAGGNRRKLRLWATFHPEMVLAEVFAGTCRKLLLEGISLCAGAVGVPQNVKVLRELRMRLPEKIYLWINKMDGLGRAYTPEETEDFLKIDPYFLRELSDVPADPERCRKRLFVEGSGRIHTCNISRNMPFRWDELPERLQKDTESREREERAVPLCGQKRCSCYLAYGGREDFMNELLFGPYPVFRIPRRAEAVFLDIMGTLILKRGSGTGRLPGAVQAGLMGLHRDKVPLFFATTLPYEEAMKQCQEIRHLFCGGVFSGGAHVVFIKPEGRKEHVYEINEKCLSVLEEIKDTVRCRVLPYRKDKKLYKITMLRPKAAGWQAEEAARISEILSRSKDLGVRVFTEGNCLQIVSEKAGKREGVRLICEWLGIHPEETVSAGDSAEDTGMWNLYIIHGRRGE